MRCCALKGNGLRCRARNNVKLVTYHGEHEMYGCSEESVPWVAVALCEPHRKAIRASRYSEREMILQNKMRQNAQ